VLFTINRKSKMGKFCGLTGLILLIGLSTILGREPAISGKGSQDSAVQITIIYDNYQADQKLQTDWGFACLVQYLGNQLLFDAGRNSELYRRNVELLGIKPQEIPTLFISHEHGDHTAGIPWITKVNPSITCYLPASYADQLQTSGTLPPNSIRVHEPIHLYATFYSTGDDFALFREQGLVVKTEKGGVLITGCSHPGVVEMVRRAEQEFNIEIFTVIGGLHLMDKSADEIEQIAASLKEMGVRKICPTHCTGDESIALLKESFGEGYIAGGTGARIILQ
jgi:7,8-dihydropterin-6-yl-methyl-4-(beta-D-ribofuranosyl)aminobenzene 5'-phosphate synthase